MEPNNPTDPIRAGRNLIDHNLTNHPPTSPATINDMEIIRAAAKQLGYTIDIHCPSSREKSLALTNLEQTVMWAIAAIARNQ